MFQAESMKHFWESKRWLLLPVSSLIGARDSPKNHWSEQYLSIQKGAGLLIASWGSECKFLCDSGSQTIVQVIPWQEGSFENLWCSGNLLPLQPGKPGTRNWYG